MIWEWIEICYFCHSCWDNYRSWGEINAERLSSLAFYVGSTMSMMDRYSFFFFFISISRAMHICRKFGLILHVFPLSINIGDFILA